MKNIIDTIVFSVKDFFLIKQYTIVKLEMTCDACPSQWEGKLDDGCMIYIRYRWGHLTASVSNNPTNNVDDALDGEYIYDDHVGDEFDGSMTTKEMLKVTSFRYTGEFDDW